MMINNSNFNVQSVGSGVPFIWGHGLMGNMAAESKTETIDWAHISEVATLIRYDARGHGRSQPTFAPEDYHWSNLAKDMLAIADRMRFDTFIPGGQSMGSATALYAALTAPDRIRALVLVNPPTAWETREAQSSLYEQMAALIETQGIETLASLIQQTPVQPAWRLEVQPELKKIFLNTLQAFKPNVLAQILRGARLCNLPPREQLRSLTMPTLILAWGDDPIHPVSTAEELSRLLPNSRTTVAHDMRDVSTWTDQIRDFISALS